MLEAIVSQWSSPQTLGTVKFDADPIVGFRTEITEIVISGWEEMASIEQLMRVNRLPCIYVFVVEMTPGALLFQQDDTEQMVFAASLKLIDQGTSYDTLEKSIYRYTDALYQIMRADMYLASSGWAVSNVAKAYSATEPSDPLLKAGQVSFSVTVEDVYD